jgi:hypothetical protein
MLLGIWATVREAIPGMGSFVAVAGSELLKSDRACFWTPGGLVGEAYGDVAEAVEGFVEQIKTLPRGNVYPPSRNLPLAGGL